MAIGFDLGDTLCEYAGIPLNWEREYPAALAAVAESCRCELTPERIRSGIQLLLLYNTRVTPRAEEREFTAEHIFAELVSKWALSGECVGGAIAAFFGHFRQTLRAFPETASVLSKLREGGIRTAVLTDVPYGMPRALVVADVAAAGLAIPDEELLTSTTIGHRKPHPAGFRAMAEQLGVSCSRLLYVGNERKDIHGARAAGCRTALLWRSASEPPAWGQACTIRSLEHLLELDYDVP